MRIAALRYPHVASNMDVFGPPRKQIWRRRQGVAHVGRMVRLVRYFMIAVREPPPLLRSCRPLPASILSMRRSSFLVRFILIGILLHIYVGFRLIPDMPVSSTRFTVASSSAFKVS